MDLREAEDIKKRGKEYTQELYKKYLNDPDNCDGVTIHLKLEILDCEVKWALGSITMNKASWGDRIPPELHQVLKADAVKVLHWICQQIWKTQQWPKVWKRSERQCQRMFKLSHNYTHLNCEHPDVQAGFRKGRGTRDQIANFPWITVKSREFQKNIYFCFINYTKALIVWISTNCGKFFK